MTYEDRMLNLKIMNLLGLVPLEVWKTEQGSDGCIHHTQIRADDPVDYCNNWNDLMPLVEEYGILESPTLIRQVVECDTGEIQRALAECLLKVLTNNKETM